MARKKKQPPAHPLDIPDFLKREDAPTPIAPIEAVQEIKPLDEFRESRPATPGAVVYVELYTMPVEGIDNVRWPVSGRAPFLIYRWGRKWVELLHIYDLERVRIRREHPVLQKTWALDYATPLLIAKRIRQKMAERDNLQLDYARVSVDKIATFVASLPAFGVTDEPAPSADEDEATSGQPEDQMAKKAKAKKVKSNSGGGKRASENSLYVLKKEPKEDEKMPSQMKGIIACLKKGGGEIVRSTLVERLPSYLKTKQDAGRILQFYQKRLIDGGFMTVKKPEATVA